MNYVSYIYRHMDTELININSLNPIIDWVYSNIVIISLIILLIFICFCKNKNSYLFHTSDSNQTGGFRQYSQYGQHVLEDGYYAIRGSRNNRFCTDDANGVICNMDLAGPNEVFRLQNLGNGQYAIKSMKHGLWCSQTITGLRCDSPTIGDWQIFNLRRVGDRTYSIQSNKNKRYCSDSGHGMVCDVPDMYGWEFQKFTFIPVPWENVK